MKRLRTASMLLEPVRIPKPLGHTVDSRGCGECLGTLCGQHTDMISTVC